MGWRHFYEGDENAIRCTSYWWYQFRRWRLAEKCIVKKIGKWILGLGDCISGSTLGDSSCQSDQCGTSGTHKFWVLGKVIDNYLSCMGFEDDSHLFI